MNYLNKIKNQFLEQFLPESLIKDLERDAEYIKKDCFAVLEKDIANIEERIVFYTKQNNLDEETKKEFEEEIKADKKVLNMESLYLSLKSKYKNDTDTRLSLAKDWNTYFETYELYDNLQIDPLVIKTETKDEIMTRKSKEEEYTNIVRGIEHRFERLLK